MHCCNVNIVDNLLLLSRYGGFSKNLDRDVFLNVTLEPCTKFVIITCGLPEWSRFDVSCFIYNERYLIILHGYENICRVFGPVFLSYLHKFIAGTTPILNGY